MKKINLIILTLFLLSLISCERDKDMELTIITIASERFSPSYTNANITCDFRTSATIRNAYVQYALTDDFKDYEERKMTKTKHSFTIQLDSLQDDMTYYVRYAVSNSYSSAMVEHINQFKTLEPSIPSIRIDSIFDIFDTYAKGRITLEYDGGVPTKEFGICWSTKQNPTKLDSTMLANDTLKSLDLMHLAPSTTYYARAYAENKKGIGYSDEICFITFALPQVQMNEITNIQLTSALLSAKLLFNGNDTATIKGFCWGEQPEPTIDDSQTAIDTLSDDFTYLLSNLKDETQYYVRAYAQNKIGIVYGETKLFTTQSALPPTVSINEVTNVEYHTATIAAEVTSDGGASVTERGICYSTAENPTTESTKIISGKGTGSYTINLSNLQDSTTCYVRAYAINKKGIAYGEQKSFMTKGYMLPTITTANPTNVEYTSATVGGNISSDGGASVTECGICYSTTENPAIESNKIVSGKGTGSYTINLTDLQDSTTYYVRAYAINKKGTSYGKQVSFTTKGYKQPTITTSIPTNVSYTSATAGGSIISDGGLEVFERGICYSIKKNPTIEDTAIISATETNNFTVDLINLSDSTTYYVRAYAINELGIGYGEEMSFTTMKNYLPIVTTSIPVNISYTSATIGGEIVFDGGLEIIEKGVCYSTSNNPTISNDKIIADSSLDTFAINIVGLPNGTTYYARAYAINNKGIAYGNEVSFTTLAYFGNENGYDWVDLGLSVKWATMNVGATSNTGAGILFAWGEIESKTTYNWSTYKWCNGLPTALTKYNTDSVNGLVDNKTILEQSDDVAAVNWGGDWRMPTVSELIELITKCSWSRNGSSWIVVGPNGNSIKLISGNYWSSSLDGISTSNAYYLWLYNYNHDDYKLKDMTRCSGAYIRAVR